MTTPESLPDAGVSGNQAPAQSVFQHPWALVSPAVVLYALGVVHVVLLDTVVVTDALLAVVPGTMLLGGARLVVRSDVPASHYPRVLRRVVAGGLVVSIVPVLMLQAPQVTVETPRVALIVGAWIGSTAGLITGYQEARAIQRAVLADHNQRRAGIAQAERDRLTHLNHLLRHDILNDVAVIQGYAELLLTGDDADDRRYVENIKRQSIAIADLIQNVRAYLDALEKGDTSLQVVPLRPVIETEVARLESSFPGSAITYDVPDDVTVFADDLVHSVFSNLFRNAILHNPSDEPSLSVTVRERDDRVTVAIEDNGPGIPATEREQLFSKASEGDHGFGLFLVKTLVDRYDGRVDVESTSTNGTTITVTLTSGSATAR